MIINAAFRLRATAKVNADWFTEMSPKHQQEYLIEHPNSARTKSVNDAKKANNPEVAEKLKELKDKLDAANQEVSEATEHASNVFDLLTRKKATKEQASAAEALIKPKKDAYNVAYKEYINFKNANK